MDTSDTAAVIVAVASGMAVVVLVFAIVQLTKTLRVLRESIEEMRHETLPVVAEMRTAVGQASADLERVDGLLGTAESISVTLDSASRLAYLAFSNPVIKTIAFASGTGRAARRFRRRRLHE
jgi:inosine-uridine nucleoside N-ribohydrolase